MPIGIALFERPTSTPSTRRGLCRIAPLDAADVLVSDTRLPRDARALLEQQIPEIVLAPNRKH